MAAFCGPSNALQKLQKHASADRSFHQDRLCVAGPSSSQQGFRSATPGAAPSGWIETEFDTFSAGGAPPPVAVGLGGPELHAAQSWAGDFQRLEISHAPQEFVSPSLQQQQQQQQQQQPHWGLEFATRLQQRKQQQQQSYTAGYSGYSSPFSPQPDMGGGVALLPTATTAPPTAVATEFRFDESAFERAFEEAARDAQLETETVFEKAEDHMSPEPQHREKEKEPFVKDSDDLARTAGQLLDSVRQDTSTKFQNSNFLALMRKLRDHEVVVEGDKMVEVHS